MRLFLMSLVLGSSLALADCKLNHPIKLDSADFMKVPMVLKGVQVSAVPTFVRPEKYDPATDKLEVRLSGIRWNGKETGFVAAKLSVLGKLEAVGLSSSYSGDFGLTGSKKDSAGLTTYETRDVYTPKGEQHAPGEAVSTATVKVEKGDIVSIEIGYPVYKVWKSLPSGDVLAFTGKNETVCVLDAE